MRRFYSLIEHSNRSLQSSRSPTWTNQKLKGNALQRTPIKMEISNFHSINNIVKKSQQSTLANEPSRLPPTYKTRESIEQVLLSDKYNSLTRTGWVVHELPDYQHNHPSIIVLEKNYINQFHSWDHILTWLYRDVRPIADELNHHPDIEIKNFRHLKITLFTHSLKALTPRDLRLAMRLDQVQPTPTG